jgi:hypothetical protein
MPRRRSASASRARTRRTGPWYTIVGVAGTVKRNKLYELTNKETYYYYYQQQPERSSTLALKTGMAPDALVGPLRAALLRIDPEQPIYDVKTMQERIRTSLDDRRTPMLLLGLFAALALALSAIGIYGVLAFSVASRTGELGVRMSIGAQRSHILRLVLADGARLAGIGLGIGLIGSLALSQLVKTQLYGVGAVDPLTLIGVVLVLAATAFVACWLPARRASASVRPKRCVTNRRGDDSRSAFRTAPAGAQSWLQRDRRSCCSAHARREREHVQRALRTACTSRCRLPAPTASLRSTCAWPTWA